MEEKLKVVRWIVSLTTNAADSGSAPTLAEKNASGLRFGEKNSDKFGQLWNSICKEPYDAAHVSETRLDLSGSVWICLDSCA